MIGSSAHLPEPPPPPSDPDRALALIHAAGDTRPALAALFALDEALAGVLRSTSEPTIGMMRLAWWRESLEGIDGRPRAQPALRAVAACLPGMGPMLVPIVDGWEALLEAPLTEAEVAEHGRMRGGRLFAVAARVLAPGAAADPVAAAGEVWALVDLAFHMRDRTLASAALRMADQRLLVLPDRWPPRLRSLAALVAVARLDLANGLDRPRRLGGPGRAWRMLRTRISGRT